MTISPPSLAATLPARLQASLTKRLASMFLPVATRGHLKIVLPNGEAISRAGELPGIEAIIVFKSWRGLWRILSEGEIGFAQGWIDGDWSSPDLDAVLAFCLDNADCMETTGKGSYIAAGLNQFRHRLNANTRQGSRRNIAAHYDLGNAFYAQWLDRGMNYSAALFGTGDETLEAAQDIKLDRAIELLDLSGGEDVLEIGCGWGALVSRLVARGVGSVTGLTLSHEQLAFALERIGNAPPVPFDLRLQDYRDCDGRFDRIVSIEMVEAVGEEYWPTYFAKLCRALKPGGTAILQAITIGEGHFDAYRKQPDFIQRCIFPGGMLPTKSAIRDEAARAGLTLVHQEKFGLSYARTLGVWRDRFLAAWPDIASLGFDERFRKMWLYYLAYCELGFRSGRIDVGFYKLMPNYR
jgi:cyclopropane-fatty-acyl-phospholipid synthase